MCMEPLLKTKGKEKYLNQQPEKDTNTSESIVLHIPEHLLIKYINIYS